MKYGIVFSQNSKETVSYHVYHAVGGLSGYLVMTWRVELHEPKLWNLKLLSALHSSVCDRPEQIPVDRSSVFAVYCRKGFTCLSAPYHCVIIGTAVLFGTSPGWSLMENANRKRSGTEPRGIPVRTGDVRERQEPALTLKVLLVRDILGSAGLTAFFIKVPIVERINVVILTEDLWQTDENDVWEATPSSYAWVRFPSWRKICMEECRTGWQRETCCCADQHKSVARHAS